VQRHVKGRPEALLFFAAGVEHVRRMMPVVDSIIAAKVNREGHETHA
jgi:hypothetical protein